MVKSCRVLVFYRKIQIITWEVGLKIFKKQSGKTGAKIALRIIPTSQKVSIST